MAHRVSISEVTHSSPHFLLYGKRPRLPLSKMIPDCAPFLDRDSKTCRQHCGWHNMEHEWFVKETDGDLIKAKDATITEGDHVTLKVNEPLTLTSKRDPLWIVIKQRGPTALYSINRQGGPRWLIKRSSRWLTQISHGTV